MPISHLDLHSLNDHLVDEFLDDVREVFAAGQYLSGQHVQKFEDQLARYAGSKFSVGVNSGTDAILLCLNALGVGRGDEVLVPVLAPASVAMAVVRLGATPVFVDVRHDSLNIDPDQAMASLSSTRTKAMIVEHLFGQAAEIDRVMQIARTYSVAVLEECSMSAGARFHGRRLGSFGNFGCFGFAPSANLGTIGSGGAIVTNDENFVDLFRRLRENGQSAGAAFEVVGYDTAMHALQAAFLVRKLAELDDNNLDRVANAKRYAQLFEGSPVIAPSLKEDLSHVYHSYVIQAPDRQALIDHLTEKGIETVVPYRSPLHMEPCFRYLEYKEGAFPVAEDVSTRLLSIPVAPGMKKSQVEEVASAILSFYGVVA